MMTDQERHDYAADHLSYELTMLYETAAWLVSNPAVRNEPIVMNALIESFTVHARCLALFLYPEEAKKWPDDVTSDEYVADVQQWRNARGAIPSELKTVIERTGKEIAHLTTKRYPPDAPQKGWSPEAIVRAFFEPLRRFAAHVRPGCLHISVSEFIAALPAPSAPPAPSGGLGVLGLGSPSGPDGTPIVTHSTDASTPWPERP